MKIGEFRCSKDIKYLSEFAGLKQIVREEDDLVEVLLNEWLGLRVNSTKSGNVVRCRADVQLVSHVDTKLADEFWISFCNFEQRLSHDLSSLIIFSVILALLK